MIASTVAASAAEASGRGDVVDVEVVLAADVVSGAALVVGWGAVVEVSAGAAAVVLEVVTTGWAPSTEQAPIAPSDAATIALLIARDRPAAVLIRASPRNLSGLTLSALAHS